MATLYRNVQPIGPSIQGRSLLVQKPQVRAAVNSSSSTGVSNLVFLGGGALLLILLLKRS